MLSTKELGRVCQKELKNAAPWPACACEREDCCSPHEAPQHLHIGGSKEQIVITMQGKQNKLWYASKNPKTQKGKKT